MAVQSGSCDADPGRSPGQGRAAVREPERQPGQRGREAPYHGVHAALDGIEHADRRPGVEHDRRPADDAVAQVAPEPPQEWERERSPEQGEEPQRLVAGTGDPGPGTQQQVVERRTGVGQPDGAYHAAWTDRGILVLGVATKGRRGCRGRRLHEVAQGGASLRGGVLEAVPGRHGEREDLIAPDARPKRKHDAKDHGRAHEQDQRPRRAGQDQAPALRTTVTGSAANSTSSSPASPSAVVLGGGLSGIAAALTLARAGLRVTVVERGASLGGLAGSLEQDGHFYPLGYHHILHRDRTPAVLPRPDRRPAAACAGVGSGCASSEAASSTSWAPRGDFSASPCACPTRPASSG